jgi:proteasome lid subunit RPN8/RPN11
VSDGESEALVISRAYADEIVAHARAESPAEACGLIAGAEGLATRLYRIPNADPSIYRYNMEPRAQLRAIQDMDDRGWDLLAIYHSHTHTPAYPSPTDISLAFYPDVFYAIVTLQDAENPRIRAFRVVGSLVREVPVCIAPGSVAYSETPVIGAEDG